MWVLLGSNASKNHRVWPVGIADWGGALAGHQKTLPKSTFHASLQNNEDKSVN
jgi:hypothetical protein